MHTSTCTVRGTHGVHCAEGFLRNAAMPARSWVPVGPLHAVNDKTKDHTADILMPYERAITLIF